MAESNQGANLNGQWVGRFTGTNSGTAVLEIDDRGTHFEGWLYVFEDNPALPRDERTKFDGNYSRSTFSGTRRYLQASQGAVLFCAVSSVDEGLNARHPATHWISSRRFRPVKNVPRL
jgi:hypothetical protein